MAMESVQKRPLSEGLGRYLGTRRGAVTAAAVAAALAAVVLLVFLNQYKSNVKSGNQTESVLVANQLIPKGTNGDAVASSGLFRPTAISSDNVRTAAVTDAAALSGRVATRDIYPGQQITASDFAKGGNELRGRIQGNQRAIAIPLDPSHGILGELKDGDHVDVLAGFNATNGSSGTSQPVLKTLLQNVLVLKAPTSFNATTNSGKDGNVTLRVTDTEAARVAYASDQGKIWLVLRPPAGAKQTRPSAVTLNALLSGTPAIPRGGR
jgi:Flp pilus assembly protein CpaB